MQTKSNPLIGGITRFSTSDYPNHLAAVIFLQGCPWKCGYCHNPHFQERTLLQPLDWLKISDWLKTRKGLIDGVVFSGGEPCADPALLSAINIVKDLGFKIGLHTGGAYPRRLKSVLPYIDWVGFDIKAPFHTYAKITGIDNSGVPAKISAQYVLNHAAAYEFRTTMHSSLLSEEDLWIMACDLQRLGVKNYVWQMFRTHGCTNERLNTEPQLNYPNKQLLQKVTSLFPQFTFRQAY